MQRGLLAAGIEKAKTEELRYAAKQARAAIPELIRMGRTDEAVELGRKAAKFEEEADAQDLERRRS